MSDKVFAEGFYFRIPRESAPDYIKGTVSVHAEKFSEFLNKHKDDEGYVRLSIKESTKGTVYAELDTWKPTAKPQALKEVDVRPKVEYPKNDINPDDIPF